MRNIVLLAAVFLTSNVFASDITEELKKSFPGEYAEMKASCEEWANEDGITADKRGQFVNSCIDDEIGYLLENSDDGELQEEDADNAKE